MELEIDQLNVTLGQKKILTDISLQTQKGQFVGLIGANGSGKSTLLKTVYKALKPDSGTIVLNGLDLVSSHEKQVAQNLSVVSQFNELSFDLTVEQIVFMGRTPYKGFLEGENREDEQIVTKALEKTGLSSYRHRSFLSLSGGEKQRVVMARAITQQPNYLILDEPTNHLDIRYHLEILETVKELGIGILAALHDLEDAAYYCDYLFALKEGQIVAQGTSEEVLTSSLVTELYGVACQIYRHPITNGLGFYYSRNEEIVNE
ncbi:ABC transporter ATP-binding protein [Enterococcus bulliens]